MNMWIPRILKTIFGAFLGTVLGLIVVALFVYDLDVTHPYNKALGSQDSRALVLGLVIAGLMLVGGCVGFVIGAVTALILDVLATRRRSFSQIDPL